MTPPQQPASPRDQLEEAERLRQQGKLDRAESLCNALTRRHPDYVAALHTLGLVYLDKRSYDRALACLVRASMFDPDNWMILTALSMAYLRLDAPEMSVRTLERALASRPNDPAILATLGEIRREEREYEAAERSYRQALAIDPQLVSAAMGQALCLAAMGRSQEAARVLEDSYRRGHRSLNLLHIMSTLPARTLGIDLLAAIDEWERRGGELDAEARNTIAFVRAAALDKAGRHAEAWEHLAPANRAIAARSQAELKASVSWQEKSLSWLRGAKFSSIEASDQAPISLFILGPSRAGKATLERLICSLPGVTAGYENPIIAKAARRTYQAAAMPPSNSLEELPSGLWPAFRENYRQDLLQRAGSARVFTNTLHGVIHDAALIARLIPNSRFVILKRDHDDIALRTYMTKYLAANSYAYDLKAIYQYLRWYDQMIDLTVEKVPEIVRVVRYENMVSGPAAVRDAIAGLCGLSADAPPMPELGDDRECASPYRALMR